MTSITATTASTRSSFTSAGFTPHLIPIPATESDPLLTDLEIYTLRYQYTQTTTKEPLLLIHGHPQNLSIWHRVAPILSKEAKRDIILVDLRGYGHSSVPRVRNFIKLGHTNDERIEKDEERIPQEDVLRARYSKREMGRDFVEVMKQLGYNKFAVVGHDRGGRVAHRMAVDHPEIITKIMTLDIVPTYDLYTKTEVKFATAYWHWFFLIQDYPMPEELIVHSPKSYLDKLVTRFPRSTVEKEDKKESEEEETFPQDILKSYLSTLSSPPRVHAMCEDYRCSAPGGIDFEQDEEDRKKGKKITQPLRALWGKRGVNQALFGEKGPLDLWQNVSHQKVTGKSIDCGHYMPEEAPKEIADEILTFFA
ncbi:hypothetical protein L7F22_003242 [Adiantum nelumboides]|nr:hypothetical protein [Adiantum nelumboides]